MNKLPRAVLTVAAILLLVLTLLRVVRCWSNDSHLEHVAGAWVALAMDMKDGIFYRAAYGPYGYGGTRFFPLYFSLHAAAIRVFGTWRATGYLLSGASIVLLLAGVYYWLRQLGVGRWLAAAGVTAVLAGSSVQDSALTIREDGMAAMFNVWAVLMCSSEEISRRRLYAGALLFTLAFATKETSVFGLIAVVLWLALRRRTSQALHLLLATVAGYLLVLSAIYFGSGGRALEIFRLTMRAGSTVHTLLTSPGALLDILPNYWAESILLALAGAALLARPARRLRELPPLLFISTLAVTLAIVSSEGTGGNHLLDLLVASVVLFITVVAEWSLEFGLAGCALAALVAVYSFLPVYHDVDSNSFRDDYQDVISAVGRTDRPILSDNPLIPIIAGQRPYVADAFMFRVIADNRPGFSEPLWRMLDERQFAAVVLQDNPETDQGKDTYTHIHFGGQFLEHLHRSYEPAGTPGEHYLYLPKQ